MATRKEEVNWLYRMKDMISPDLVKLSARMDAIEEKIKKIEGTSGKAFKKMAGDAKGFGMANNKMVQDITSQMPRLGGALNMISNPYVLAGAAVSGLTLLLNNSIAKAETFNNQFLELRNLNLDKTKEQLATLNQEILDLAFEKALDPTATAKAFFDIQSATAKYGDEVEKIVGRTGEFAMATKTNQDAAVNAVAKGMAAYKFGADQLDAYLESSAKTVQVGITTFDELARVQTEYAGAAVGANQTFDTANKIFAVFTRVSKNVDIAATKTKTAFEGLSDPNVLKNLQKYNVAVFDQNKNLLNTEQIIQNMIPLIGQMNDQQFSQFMGSVGGPEGMRDLLKMIRGDAQGLTDAFTAFDNSKFSIDAALENAKNDLTVMKTMVRNQINTGMVELGQIFLPYVVEGFQSISEILGPIRDYIKGSRDESSELAQTVNAVLDIFTAVWRIANFFTLIIIKIISLIGEWASGSSAVQDIIMGIGQLFEWIGQGIDWLVEKIDWLWKKSIGPILDGMESAYSWIKGGRPSDGGSGWWQTGIPGAPKDEGSTWWERALAPTKKAESLFPSAPAANSNNPENKKKTTYNLDSDINAVNAGGKSVKHITVNINKLVETINNHVKNVKEGMANSDEIIKEALLKVVHDSEMTLGTSN